MGGMSTRTVRQSIGGVSDLTRSTRSARPSIGSVADLRAGKENVKPRAIKVPSKTEADTVIKPDAVCQLVVGLLPENVDASQPSLIRDQAVEHFDLAFLESLEPLLTAKVGTKKFDSVSKDKEQTALIAGLRAALVQTRTKQAEFVRVCLEIEKSMVASSQAMKLTLDSVATSKEELSTNLQAYTEQCAALKEELGALQAEQARVLAEKSEMERVNAMLASTKAIQEQKIDALSSEVQQQTKVSEFRGTELDKTRECFEAKKKELAELQIAHRVSEVNLQQSFNEKLDVVKSQLLDATSQGKAAQEGKAQLEQKLQEAAVRAAQSQGELETEKGKLGMVQRELDRAVSEIEGLKSQLTDKGVQFVTVMEGFQRSQKFNEERITAMCNEKKEADSKIWALQSKKEEQEATIRDTLKKLEDATRKGEEDNTRLETALAEQTKAFEKVTSEFEEARQMWEQTTKATAEQEKATQEELTRERDSLKTAKTELQQELTTSQSNVASLTQNCQDTAKQLELFKKHAGVDSLEQLTQLCKVSAEAEYLRQQLNGKENLAVKLQEMESNLKQARDQLFQGEVTRRALHNQIQELKGNVRVYVRVRPNEEGEDAGIECESDNRSLSINSEEGKEHAFQFDHVWSSKANQGDIFAEVAPLVQSSLDGYNVCLFSYGQTGSGKTFTMQGANMGESRGIIPRSIEKIMEEAARLSEQGWQYRLEVTFLEIYNENVRDLLLENSSEQSSLQILMHPDGGCHVPDLTRMEVTDRSQIDGIMRRAAKHRSVARTNMNSRSSRSHSVFTLHLTGTNETKDVTLKGSLNLCDLAGSERLDKSGVTGERLKETQAINKSLSCLAGVFSSLASKNAHIPYRDSKLTYLLQQCFSAQGKTLMLVNLSPSSTSYGESLCSLRFARQVNNVELGRPAANQAKRVSSAGLSERAPTPSKRSRSSITQR